MEKMVVPCEVYSRVVGYFRPVGSWNNGKKQEFSERVTFSEKVSLENPKAKVGAFGSSSIEEYKLFTFPNCDKCEEVKSFLKEKPYTGAVIDLKSPEGNKEFRKYYGSVKGRIRRTDDGTMELPVVFLMNNGSVVSTAQGLEETKKIMT